MERKNQCALFFLVVLIAQGDGFEFDLDDGVSVLKLSHELIKELFYTWNALAPDEKEKQGSGVEFPILKAKEKRIMEHLTEVSRRIDQMRQGQHFFTDTTTMLLRDFPQAIRLENRLQQLADIQSRINTADMQLNRYIHHGYINETQSWKLEKYTLEDLVTSIVSHEPNSIHGLMEEMQNMLTSQGRNKGGLFYLLMVHMKKALPMPKRKLPPFFPDLFL